MKKKRVFIELTYGCFVLRLNAATIEESELDAVSINHIRVASYAEVISMAIQYENNMFSASRNITIKDIYEGFVSDGMLSATQFLNLTKQNYKPPAGCLYTGPYNFDSRCRLWFLETIDRVRVTPIEPLLFYSEKTNPFLASNLCKRQTQYTTDTSGNIKPTSCGYSVNCLNFRLSTLQQFFDAANYKKSKTIMIDPRSEIVLYNSVSGYSNEIRYLKDATKDIFPSSTSKQAEFLKAIQQHMPRDSSKTETLEDLIIKEEGECTFSSKQTLKSLGLKEMDFKSYTQLVYEVNNKDPEYLKLETNDKSFVFTASDGEEVFVAINAIVIIEKIKTVGDDDDDTLKLKNLIELQDLFLVIDILPKNLLTTWTDQLKAEIYAYLLYFGIGLVVICCFSLLATGLISYKVGVMIEVPLIHMIGLLHKLEKEGGAAALAVIEEVANLQDDSIFLSQDLAVLFESFICIFRMVHLATQDIFTVDDSRSLLQLNYQINFFKQFNNKRVLGICYNNIGNIHFQNKRYLEAMENYNNAIILAYYEAGLYADNEIPNEDVLKFLLSRIAGKSEKSEVPDEQLACIPEQRLIAQNESGNQEIEVEEQDNSKNIGKQQQQNQQQQIKDEIAAASSFRYRRTTSGSVIENYQITPKKRKSSNKSTEAILEVIFDRRLNFSQALFMHNISQELSEKTKRCRSTIDWQDYERVLVDLIEINKQFTNLSYGRSVILFSQLSLCKIKMGKIDEAIYEQGQAIEKYESSLIIDDIRQKSASCGEGEALILNRSLNESFCIRSVRDSRQKGEHTQHIQQVNKTSDMSPQNKLKQFIDTNNTNIFISERRIDTVEEEDNTIFSFFRQRQNLIKTRTNFYRLHTNSSSAKADPSSPNGFQQELMARLSLKGPASVFPNLRVTQIAESDSFLIQRINSESQALNKKHIHQKNHITLDSNRARSHSQHKDRANQQSKFHSEERKKYEQKEQQQEEKRKHTRSFISNILTGRSKRDISPSPSHIREISNSYCLNDKAEKNNNLLKNQHYYNEQSTLDNKKQILSIPKNSAQHTASQSFSPGHKQEHQRRKRLNSNIRKRTESKQIQQQDKSQLGSFYLQDNQETIKMSYHSIFSCFHKYQERVESEKASIQSSEKGQDEVNRLNTSFSAQQQYTRNNKNNPKSKINKHLDKEDLEQIQRYELPSDVLLFYVGLQEARILLTESKEWESSLVLTELMEKTRFYLPYYRLACLHMLEGIMKKHFLNASSVNKMVTRFDHQITFRVSSVLAVNSAYTQAAKTCLSLVNEVLVEQEDDYSMLIYSHNSFQQVIPSLSIKQLSATGAFFASFIETLSGEVNSINLPTFTDLSDLNKGNATSNPGQNPINSNCFSLNNLSPYLPNFSALKKQPSDDEDLFQTQQQNALQYHNEQQQPENYQVPLNKYVSFGVNSGQNNVQNEVIIEPNNCEHNKNNLSGECSIMLDNLVQPHQDNIKNCQNNNTSIEINIIACESPDCQSQNQQQTHNFYAMETAENESNRQILSSPISHHNHTLSQQNPFSRISQQSAKMMMVTKNDIQEDNKKPKSYTVDFDNNGSQLSGTFKIKPKANTSSFGQEGTPIISLKPATRSSAKIVDSIPIQPSKHLKQYSNEDSYSSSNILRKADDPAKQQISQQKQCFNKQETSGANSFLPLKRSSFAAQPILNLPRLLPPLNSKANKLESSNLTELERNEYHPGEVRLEYPCRYSDECPTQSDDQRTILQNETQLFTEGGDDCIKTEGQNLNESAEEAELHRDEPDLSPHQIPSKVDLSEKDSNQSSPPTFCPLNLQDVADSASKESPLDFKNNISKKNINLILHIAVRKAILSYFEKDCVKLAKQRRLTELGILNQSKKFILFITDQSGITENRAYTMLASLLYETQIQLLVLQLHQDESLKEQNEVSDCCFKNKSVIKYFYTQDKLIQYVRNKREPMKNFGIPLLVEHFSV